mmetsp:Transcript_1584/g.5244  ORF Transcript_1584/g.5244 Transcript_1584/m.5244 type:complete len:314 (+) Transcript_1584:484-1425(+)
MRLEPPRDGDGVLLLLRHPQRHRLQPAQGEPAVERPEERPFRVLVEVNLLRERLALHREYPAGDVGVPGDELRRRRHRDVRAERERGLEHRRHDAVVHAHQRASLVRVIAYRADVRDLQTRVRRGLEHHHRRVPAVDGSVNRVEIVHVHVHHLDANLRDHLREQPRRAAVDVVPGDDPLARLDEPRHGHQRGHAGGEGERAVGALELCHLHLEEIPGRVAAPGVVVRPVRRRARLRERRGLVQRRRGRHERVFQRVRRVHESRGDAPVVGVGRSRAFLPGRRRRRRGDARDRPRGGDAAFGGRRVLVLRGQRL